MELTKTNMPKLSKRVRINIQNKELWEKELRLLKRIRTHQIIAIVLAVIFLIGIVAIPMLKGPNGPKWPGYVWIGFFPILVAYSFWVITQELIHRDRAYIYKFGTKKQLKALPGKNVKQNTEQVINTPKGPKFKVGQWITNGICNIQISSLDDTMYYHDNDIIGGDIESIDKQYRLWDITDAKDGDILVCESGWTCIFKELDKSDSTFSSYCFMPVINGYSFVETGSECHTTDNRINGNLYPATKEQQSLFFSKMREAGYVWDSEKKELKDLKSIS